MPSSISVETLRQMLILAYQKVANKKESINSINMFPVPDKDTGDNLTATLKGVYDAIEQQTFNTTAQLRDTVVDGAICNASGNIGIIVTGFLNGFLSHLSNEQITIANFNNAFSYGMVSAYESIQNPKEGTILDVIQGANESFLKSSETDFKKNIKNAIKIAKKSLDATQLKMDLYQKTNTVDAGGYGFLLILEGFLEGLNGKTKHINIKEKQKKYSKTTSFLQILTHRYEVISLLRSVKLSKEKIINQLISYGDCLDIIQANQKIKIHIHTDLPDEVVKIISGYGTIINTQTTDMTQQIENNNSPKKELGIVTDSAASLPPGFIIENDIKVVPFKVKWEKVDQEISNSNISIYKKMKLFENKNDEYGWPKTSQPSPQSFLYAFKEQLQKYNSIICFTISSAVSGSYNCALQARSLLSTNEQDRVIIPNFYQIGPSQAMLILEATQLIKQGYTESQVEKELLSISPNIKVFAIPEKISWLVKGGRFSGKKVKVINLLQKINFHPTFHSTPKGISIMKIYFGHKNTQSLMKHDLTKIAKKQNKNNLPLKVIIQHSASPKIIKKLKGLLNPNLIQIIQISQLSPVLGTHLGPGVISAAFMIENI